MTVVYAKVDSKGRIVSDPQSSVFLKNADGWTVIDEGEGDMFSHAAGNYLPGPTIDALNIPNFKHEPGQTPPYRWRTDEEKAADIAALPPPPLTEGELIKAQVHALTERGEFLEDVIAELAMMLL